ncbi:MAG TPA: ATP-binding protein [Candidatus Methylomirabilis sp.]|nr:ATP-binding protein [Candidatus Methylomirabilis sp.]
MKKITKRPLRPRGFYSFLKKQSIRKIMIVGFIVLLFFSFATTLVSIIISADRFLTTKTGNSFLSLAKSNSQQFTDEFTSQLDLLGTLARNETTYMYLRDEFDPEISGLSKIDRQTLIASREQKWLAGDTNLRDSVTSNLLSQQFNTFLRRNPGFAKILLVDKDGRSIAATGSAPDHYYVGNEKWFTDAINSTADVYLENPVISAKENKTMIEIVMAVNLPSIYVSRGFLYAQYDLGDLKIFSSTLLGDPNIHLSLVDQNGLILFNSAKDGIVRRLPVNIVLQMQADIAPQWHRGFLATGDRVIYGSAPIAFSDLSVNILDWSIYVEETENKALSYLAELSLTIAIISLFVLALASVLVYLLALQITRPIADLTRVVKEFIAGNFTRRAKESGPFEFGMLAVSFNKMVDGLLTAEKYNRNLIQIMPTALIVINPDLKIRSVNDTALKLLDYEEQDLIGAKLEKVFAPESVANLNRDIFTGEKLVKLIKKGSVKDLEMLYQNREKKEIPVDVSVSVMTDEKNKVVSFVLAAKDMRVYKELEKQRLEAERAKREETEKYVKKLEGLDKIKDDFINVTAHELRTPLFPIKSQLELILSGSFGELNDKLKDSLAMIKRNSERLYGLVSGILDIAKIKSRNLNISPVNASLTKIINETTADLQAEAEKMGIKFVLNIAPDLPEIKADPQRITQVILNLLNNALKFSDKGGNIEISAAAQDGNLLIKIKDQGAGVSEENLKKLFTPFFQVESGLVREHKGTGLGLAICRGIVEAHGGKIWAESEGEGKGSTFSFTLPIDGNGKNDTSFQLQKS